MEIKNNQLTIDIPEGMEIDLENSDLAKGIVRFKQSTITYEDVEDTLKLDKNCKSIIINESNASKLVTLDGARTMYVGSNFLKETTKYTWNGYLYNKIICNSQDILMIWVILDSFLEKWKKASLMLTLIRNILLKRCVVNI